MEIAYRTEAVRHGPGAAAVEEPPFTGFFRCPEPAHKWPCVLKLRIDFYTAMGVDICPQCVNEHRGKTGMPVKFTGVIELDPDFHVSPLVDISP